MRKNCCGMVRYVANGSFPLLGDGTTKPLTLLRGRYAWLARCEEDCGRAERAQANQLPMRLLELQVGGYARWKRCVSIYTLFLYGFGSTV